MGRQKLSKSWALAPLTDNPNAPINNGQTKGLLGRTPITVAKNEEIRQILKSFINSGKRNAKL